MSIDENPVTAALHVDRSQPIAASEGLPNTGRAALHVKSFEYGVPQPTQPYDAVRAIQVDGSTIDFKFYAGGKTGILVQTLRMEYAVPTTIPFNWAVFS